VGTESGPRHSQHPFEWTDGAELTGSFRFRRPDLQL